MPFIGNKPSAVPLTSADIADGIITSAKITDATIANADIANSTINLTTKVTGTLPVANGGTGLTALGTSLQVLRTNTGATALEFATVTSGFTLGTPVATTSGTSIDFTGIPSGTKLIIFSIQNCSTNGSDHIRIQLGDSGGVETSGYDCGLGEVGGGGGYNTSGFTDGLPIYLGTSGRFFTTTVTITLINSSTNLYNFHQMTYGNNYDLNFGIGYKTLSGTLDRVRLTGTAGGTFDSGSANIIYL
jgi:hypothetical protein